MSETIYPTIPRLKWKETPRDFWDFVPQVLLFGAIVMTFACPWWGLRHLLAFCGFTLGRSEVLPLAKMPPYIVLGSSGMYHVLQLIREHRDKASGPSQVIHRRPLSLLPPSIEPIAEGVESNFSAQIKKSTLGFFAFWIVAYVWTVWPLYNKGWVRHSLAFELLAVFGATISAFLVVFVPAFARLVRSLAFRIDTEGVTACTLRGTQFVPWEQIVTCKMVCSRDLLESKTILVLTLQDYHRKTLLTRSLYVSEATLTQISQTMLIMLSVS